MWIYYWGVQNVMGIHSAVGLLYGNQILWWQVRLEKTKRHIALQLAADPTSTANEVLMAQCAEELDRYHQFVLPLDYFLGISRVHMNQFSIILCVAHAFAVAFYNSENSVNYEKQIDWALRGFTLAHALEATFRLVGLTAQPILTARHKKVKRTALPTLSAVELGVQEMDSAGLWCRKLWRATKHQYIPRMTLNTRITQVVCWISLLAAVVDIIRQFGMGHHWNDDTAIALKVKRLRHRDADTLGCGVVCR